MRLGTSRAERNESALPRTADMGADFAGGLRRANTGSGRPHSITSSARASRDGGTVRAERLCSLQPALGKQIFDVAIAECEANIKPNRVLDDRRRELVGGKRDRRHSPSYRFN